MPDFVMEEAECNPVVLKPFIHQVGGHTSMLRFDDTTVCKPLISREHNFYQGLPPELREFTPQYRGVADVAYQEDSSGGVNLIAYPIDPSSGRRKTVQGSSSPSSGGDTAQSDSNEEEDPSSSHSQARNGRSRNRYRVKRSGSVEGPVKTYKAHGCIDQQLEENSLLRVHGHNPWQLKCQKRTIDKMRKNGQGQKTTKFMLLENLICNFEIPCVLDLKMGTRQHGDDATEEKVLLHSAKCETTTSGKLGCRLCGMQVYQADTGQYICHDKYHGRTLCERGLRDSLFQFLHNGYRLRTDILDCIVERLHRLKAMVAKQNTFRFYSSSLLVMYDAAVGIERSPRLAARPAPAAPPPPQCTQSQEMDSDASNDSTESVEDQESHDEEWWGKLDMEEDACAQSQPTIQGTSSSPSPPADRQLNVDVRMIDFAHVTHQGFRGDRIVHQGPDHGYLLGLQNLIGIFEDIKQQYLSEQL